EALGIPHAFFDRGERAPLEQVRSVHGVPTVAELIGESVHAVGQAEHMVEQHAVDHPVTIDPGRPSRLPSVVPGIGAARSGYAAPAGYVARLARDTRFERAWVCARLPVRALRAQSRPPT